jgi:hypothetical protein
MNIMRITLDLPDDVYAPAKALAEIERISLEDAVLELIRRGVRTHPPIEGGKPFPAFVVGSGAQPITLEQTLAAEDAL